MSPEQPTVSLSLTVKDGNAALDFYQAAFGAEVTMRMQDPGGGVAHAEMMIGNSKICLSDEAPEWHAVAMADGAQASCLISIATEDCDAAFQRAVKAGGTPLREPEDQFWGIRDAMIRDPFGYRWGVAQMVEEVSPEEFQRRAAELFGA